MALSRRTLLLGIGGVAGGGAALRMLTRSAQTRRVAGWVHPLSGVASATNLGVEYLARCPDEGDRSTLLAHLQGLVPVSSLLGSERGDAPLRERIRQDFADGDLVRLGGWRLSRTEVRLCGLAALDYGEATGTRGVFTPLETGGADIVHWTGASSSLVLPARMEALQFRLRSGAARSAHVTIRLDGETVDERQLVGDEWVSVRYPARPDHPNASLELTTIPAWRPANDFRTLGVAIDRVWGEVQPGGSLNL